jgi:hypothetical protein
MDHLLRDRDSHGLRRASSLSGCDDAAERVSVAFGTRIRSLFAVAA